LDFSKLARRYFQFLEESGFRVVKTADQFVRYESSKAVVQIYHGRISREVGVELGPQDGYEGIRVFGIYDIMASLGIDVRTRSAYLPWDIEQDVRRLAAYVKDYCGPALSGDQAFFHGVLESATTRSDDGARRRSLVQARTLANFLKTRGEWERFVFVLTPWEKQLSEAERAELTEARSKLIS